MIKPLVAMLALCLVSTAQDQVRDLKLIGAHNDDAAKFGNSVI